MNMRKTKGVKINRDGSPDYFAAYYDLKEFHKKNIVPLVEDYKESFRDELLPRINEFFSEYLDQAEGFLQYVFLMADNTPFTSPNAIFVKNVDFVEDAIDKVNSLIPLDNVVDVVEQNDILINIYQAFENIDRSQPYNIRLIGHGAAGKIWNIKITLINSGTWIKNGFENIDLENMGYWYTDAYDAFVDAYITKAKEYGVIYDREGQKVIDTVTESYDKINSLIETGAIDEESYGEIVAYTDIIYENIEKLRGKPL